MRGLQARSPPSSPTPTREGPASLDLRPEQTIELRRIDPAKNQFRRYRIRRDRTLFDEDCLLIEWGRLGQPLQLRIEVFESSAALQHRLHELLARRKSRGYSAVSTKANEIEMPCSARKLAASNRRRHLHISSDLHSRRVRAIDRTGANTLDEPHGDPRV